MGIAEVEKYLEDNHFSKKTYRELSANNKGSLIKSDKPKAYEFDEIAEYIFPRNKPTSADAILIKDKEIILIEFKSGLKREFFEHNFDREKCRCPQTGEICEDYVKVSKNNLRNIERELKANLFQKMVESRWILEYHLLPEVYKNDIYPEFRVSYVIVTDKVKEDPVDTTEQIMDELANVYRKDNFYERMEASVKRLYCESRFRKKAFYDKVEVCSVQEFEQNIS